MASVENPRVLLVNHREKNCGVQQFGSRLFSYPLNSEKYNCFYIDIDNSQEFEHWANYTQPQIVVYNFYTGATMPWLSPEFVRSHRSRFKQASIFHEVPLDSMGFDMLLHQDPTNTDNKYVNLTRPIPLYTPPIREVSSVPIISSFGFGLGGKGFSRLCEAVNVQFDEAIIRLNIPFAAFGDADGTGAKNWALDCRKRVSKPGISLHITHDLMAESVLLDWLNESTINCFFYDENYGRGISGTLDYSLAARKPIGITRSYQFQHIWQIDTSFLIENKTLPEIISMGTSHLNKFHDMWSSNNLIACFDRAFDQLLGV